MLRLPRRWLAAQYNKRMFVSVRRLFSLALLLVLALAAVQISGQTQPAASKPVSASTQAAADGMVKKLAYIQQNGNKAQPAQSPTILNENEINAYFAAGRVKVPAGLQQIRFGLAPGQITSNLVVDFDELTAGRRSQNPLLGLFTGTHNVQVLAHGDASGGMAHAHIDSASLDGTEIPRFLLEMFVDRLLKPKYPQASLDPTFKLPSRVDMVTIGQHKATVTQK